MDEEGIVLGRPDQVELDLIIKNGSVTVAEIKSSISKGDVITFIKKSIKKLISHLWLKHRPLNLQGNMV